MINVPSIFHEKAKGQIIEVVAGLYIAYSKTVDSNLDFLVLDQSSLDESLLAPYGGEGIFQIWDAYEYTNYSDRLVSLDLERSIEYPYNVQAAMLDITLDNYDNYFTPGSGSAIDAYNLPGRPMKSYAGFGGAGMIQQFAGLTRSMPTIDSNKGLATYHAVDFLSEIAEQNLNTIIDMRNVRTDQVLEAIVQQFGMTPIQYDFEQGRNIIPFVFFDIGQNAGEAMQKLVQAENGKLWLDENGLLRFTKRDSAVGVITLGVDDYQIIEAMPGSYSNIVNHIIISCDLREVQEFQTIYSKTPKADLSSADQNWVINANDSITRSLSLEDPCYSIVAPTLGRASNVSWFTAVKADGTAVSSGVSITGQLTNNAYIITATNTNNFAVEIDGLVLWGEPAKVYDHLDYEAYEDDSVAAYGDHRLTIADNQFFQSYEQAVAFADSILNERAFYNSTMSMSIKGDFSLQLGDILELSGTYSGRYMIDSIKYHIEAGLLETTVNTHWVPTKEWFILDVSQLDNTLYVLG